MIFERLCNALEEFHQPKILDISSARRNISLIRYAELCWLDIAVPLSLLPYRQEISPCSDILRISALPSGCLLPA